MTVASVVANCVARRRDRVLAAFTLTRLLLVPGLALTFMVDPLATTALLAAYMFADLFDGVIARRLDADGVGRVTLDSAVDRIAIDACLVAACVAGALPPVLLIGFLARDVYLTAICRRMVRERGVAIKADLVYRGLSFWIAVWAATAPFVSQSFRTAFAALIFAAALGVAADLTRLVRVVLDAPADVNDRVLAAPAVRRAVSAGEARQQTPSLGLAPITP